MKLKSIQANSFRRFSDLSIIDLPESAKLVVLTGSNGNGKSSLFDAFMTWHKKNLRQDSHDPQYHYKQDVPLIQGREYVRLDFHETPPTDYQEKKKIFYIRSAYRNQADFTVSNLSKQGSLLDVPQVSKLIDNDMSVERNYQSTIASTVEGVYNGDFDDKKVKELRDHIIGQVRKSMRVIFDDLLLKGPGNPLKDGTFFFEKGKSSNFHYKNLSGGEKSTFDILLDFIVKLEEYDNTVFCIDEPELHIHTKLQGKLLGELVNLLPNNCQLWIATHSIGMLRKARDLQNQNPGTVIFLDFHDQDFDQAVELKPANVDRLFWKKMLSVALDDLSELVAPKQIIICEGHPSAHKNKDFDAKCYTAIFGSEFPDVAFVSVGNSNSVENDKVGITEILQHVVIGTKFSRLVDRDDRSSVEITELRNREVRVLSRRNIESYLLDDEILTKLCQQVNQSEKIGRILQLKQDCLKRSKERNHPFDDLKSAAGEIYTGIKRELQLTQMGNEHKTFLRDTLAPLITSDTNTYKELRKDIFEL